MAQIQLITGPERRRRWSDEQKLTIVSAAFAPGAVVSEIARRWDVLPNQIYRWRHELEAQGAGFAEVIVSGEAPHTAGSAIEMDLAGLGQVRIPADISPALAAAVVSALVRR